MGCHDVNCPETQLGDQSRICFKSAAPRRSVKGGFLEGHHFQDPIAQLLTGFISLDRACDHALLQENAQGVMSCNLTVYVASDEHVLLQVR